MRTRLFGPMVNRLVNYPENAHVEVPPSNRHPTHPGDRPEPPKPPSEAREEGSTPARVSRSPAQARRS